MEFSRGKIRQIRHLMVLAALLVLAIIYSQEVLRTCMWLGKSAFLACFHTDSS